MPEKITIKDVQKGEEWENQQSRELTKVSKATATRDLADLVEKGVLDQKGKSKKTEYYTLVSHNEP